MELENQADKIEWHLEENERLRVSVEELQREVNTHKFVEVNFSKKSIKNQKLILELTNKQNTGVITLKNLKDLQSSIEKQLQDIE